MEKAAGLMPNVTYCADAYEVARESDALVLVTEWDEFKRLDMRRLGSLMNVPVLIDGRNFYDPEEVLAAGFIYEGIGRNGSSSRKELFSVPKEKRIMAQPLAVGGSEYKR